MKSYRQTIAVLTLLALSVGILQGCRQREPDNRIYDDMFRESRKRVMFSGNEIAEADARKMLAYAEEHGSRYGKVMAYLSLTSLAAQSGEYDDMYRYMEVARASLDVSDPAFLQAYAYFVEGTVDYSTVLSINSLMCYTKALQIYKQLGDSLMVASCYINKVNYFSTANNRAAEQANLDSARSWAPSDYWYTIRLYEGVMENELGHTAEAIDIYSELEHAMGDSLSGTAPSAATARFWTLFRVNHAMGFLGAGMTDSAWQQYERMCDIANRWGTDFDRHCCRLVRACIYAKQGPMDSAIAICNDLYENYHGYHEMTVKREALTLLTSCYESLGNYRQVLETNKELQALESTRSTDSRYLEEVFDRQRAYERSINELELRTARRGMAALVLSFLLVLIVVVFFLYRQSRKLADRQARIRELESEQRLLQQQAEIDTTRMEHATTKEQIASFAGEVRRVATGMPKNLRAQLLQGISRMEELKQQNEWDEFEQSFNRQYEGFCDSLRQHAQGITDIEMKICMLLRVGLSNREISDTLHLADNTVRTYRTRIRKKLSLGENDDLIAFLSSFGSTEKHF